MDISALPSERLVEELIRRRDDLNRTSASVEQIIEDYGISEAIIRSAEEREITRMLGNDVFSIIDIYRKETVERRRLNALNLDAYYTVNIDKKSETNPAE